MNEILFVVEEADDGSDRAKAVTAWRSCIRKSGMLSTATLKTERPGPWSACTTSTR